MNIKDELNQMFSSLRYRNFRLYFAVQCISVIGTWMQQIAMGWLAYRLTGSVLILATVTFMEQIPMLLITPFSSVMIDRFNRHTLLVITQVCSMLHALIMAVLVFTGIVEVWQIFCLSIFHGLVNALDMPTRQAFYTSLVPRESLSNAIALNASVINGCRLIGPALGGFIIALGGEGWCFMLNGLSYIAVIIALFMMKTNEKDVKKSNSNMIEGMKAGFIYIKNDKPILSLLLLLTTISFFAMPFNSFLPAIVSSIFNGESQNLGILLSCIGIGSFFAAMSLAMRKSIVGIGRTLVYAALCLGVSLIFISITQIWYVAAIFCVPIGFCIITILATINTLLQTLTREDMRGRVMGYLSMSFYGITPVGTLFMGYLERYTGLNNILYIEGALCIITGLMFLRYRKKAKLNSAQSLDYL